MGIPADSENSDLAIPAGHHTYYFTPRWDETGNDTSALERGEDGPPPLAVAPRLSPRARKLLAARDISWLDGTGAVHLRQAPALFIAVDTAPSRPAPATEWSASTATVAEYLLVTTSPADALRVPPTRRIAQDCGLSIGQVSKVLTHLDTQQWTAKLAPGRGAASTRVMIDRGGLLTTWAQWAQDHPDAGISGHATYRDATSFIVERAGLLPSGEWCVSGPAAAAVEAPYLSGVPHLDLYVSRALFLRARDPAVLAGLGIRPVRKGARITLRLAPEAVLTTARPGPVFPRASAVRVYADLLRSPLRGEEAAAHYREEVLGY